MYVTIEAKRNIHIIKIILYIISYVYKYRFEFVFVF